MIPRLPRIHAVQTHAVAPLSRAWERVAARGLEDAIMHRAQVMRPWESPAPSVATGILDDETYDWVAVIRSMLRSGGFPIVAREEELIEAARLAGDRVSAAGLGGLQQLKLSLTATT